MGKIKGLLQDYNDYYGYPLEVDDAALWEYHFMMEEEKHQEELIRTGESAYQMDTEEEKSYSLYMENKLCGEQTNTALTVQIRTRKMGK